jgi:hypothetical protein
MLPTKWLHFNNAQTVRNKVHSNANRAEFDNEETYVLLKTIS